MQFGGREEKCNVECKAINNSVCSCRPSECPRVWSLVRLVRNWYEKCVGLKKGNSKGSNEELVENIQMKNCGEMTTREMPKVLRYNGMAERRLVF